MSEAAHEEEKGESFEEASKKRAQELEDETTDAQTKRQKKTFSDANIPSSRHYHVSYMHASVVTAVACSTKHGVVLTASQDGTVKLWKRSKVTVDSSESPCLEFIKSFQAHAGAVLALAMDPKDEMACSVGADDVLKFFDIRGFDVVNAVNHKDDSSSLSSACAWLTVTVDHVSVVAVAAANSGTIYIYSPTQLLQRVCLHGSSPVTALAYHVNGHCMISCDVKGGIEVWDCYGTTTTTTSTEKETLEEEETAGAVAAAGSQVQVGGPCTQRRNGIEYTSKHDTNLYELVRKLTHGIAIAVRDAGYAIYGADHRIRLFDHKTGTLVVTYDERLKVYEKNALYAKPPFELDAMEFGRRAATEREMSQESNLFTATTTGTTSSLPQQRVSLQFDPSGRYLLIPTLMGIKVIDTTTNKLRCCLGQADASTCRFVSVCLAPGNAKVDQQLQLARTAEATTTTQSSGRGITAGSQQDDAPAVLSDALVLALAYQQRRFYVFSHVDPVEQPQKDTTTTDDVLQHRDIWNEAPSAQDQLLSSHKNKTSDGALATKAILRTTMGDITIQLLGTQVPRTVENFCGHSKSGYYDGVTFHRVIKGFMLQTGDPLGDGTGGESIWGGEFEDEFVSTLRHDRPFTVSMANAGPNTNGSQFFITTVPAPWLDNKHTVFGRVVKGMDVCSLIEHVKVDDMDKPLEEIKIVNVDLVME